MGSEIGARGKDLKPPSGSTKPDPVSAPTTKDPPNVGAVAREIAHVVNQGFASPATGRKRKDDPLKEVLGRPSNAPQDRVGMHEPGEAAAIGSGGERFDIEYMRKKLIEAKYNEVYSKTEFATSPDGWLEAAYPDGRRRPEIVAIKHGANSRHVLVLDITADEHSSAELPAGERLALPIESEMKHSKGFMGNQHRPRDLVDEIKLPQAREVPTQSPEALTRRHLEKTIEYARRLEGRLHRSLAGYGIVARDYHWRTGAVTLEQVIRPAAAVGVGTPGKPAPIRPPEPVGHSAASEREVEPLTSRRSTPQNPSASASASASAKPKGGPPPAGEGVAGAPGRAGPELSSELQRIFATHEPPEPFTRPPAVKPAPAGPLAVEAAAQLLVEVEQAIQREAAVRDSRRAGSLRTYRWWLQRGIQPPARAVYDRWLSLDESDSDAAAIARRVRTRRIDGMVVGRINTPEHYKHFEAWARDHVHSWDDFYQHFVSSEDSGVRWRDGNCTLTTWEWSDWWPANVSRAEITDDRIDRFVRRLYQEVVSRTAESIATLPSRPGTLPSGAAIGIGGVRVFRRWGEKNFFTPDNRIRLLVNWKFSPVFYEIDGVDVPAGFTLVTGADISTYLVIHEFRARFPSNDRGATIGRPAAFDVERPYTSWGSIDFPCILVRTDSLAAATSGTPATVR